MIRRKLSRIYTFLFGSICAHVLYKHKFIKGKYFEGKYFGIGKRGWQWALSDCKSRIFLGVNRKVPFPISIGNRINTPEHIVFDISDMQIFQGNGKYFQAEDAWIYIGSGTHIANNVGIITTNHDLMNPDKHSKGKDIRIGEKCWIGFNSVILPGVVLGNHTVVGAGSVVTKSFEDGFCVIAGNPAKKIKDIS